MGRVPRTFTHRKKRLTLREKGEMKKTEGKDRSFLQRAGLGRETGTSEGASDESRRELDITSRTSKGCTKSKLSAKVW